ncbi:MAG TPA: prolipoprotein diacylglyceryl transferase [Myxococcota bacterium]
MYPVLFRIPGVDWPLHSYGVLIVLGFLAAMFVAHREAKRQGKYAEEVLDFAFWALLGGMIGARVVFIIVNWREYFIDHPIDHVGSIPIPAVLVVWKGGLVFYGAALGGLLAFLWYTQKHNIRGVDKLLLADILVVGVPLAHAFGRLGCVAAGCCWGDAAGHLMDGSVVQSFPLGISFPDGALAYQSLMTTVDPDAAAWMREHHQTLPLIPVQLMESFGEACVFMILMVVRSRKWFHGQVLLTYGILYPILRSTMETMRGDAERGYVIPGILSTSQFISLCVAIASLVMIFILRRRGMASIATPSAPA